ncbi:MAG: hypothetical protein IRZ06_04135, partial [Nevskia sp.]|nr:hypothetical protein [Nevskia sp.]
KKIDAAIDRAVEAQRALRDAEHYEALAKAFDAGEIDAQGRSLLPEAVARRETRERHQESREERIAKAQEIVRGRPAWQVPRSVWADATGNLGGQARQLVEHDHREAVKAALARGESVPAEVLADYPDLSAAKPEAAQTGQKGRTRHEAKAALQDVEQAIRELRDGTATVDRYRQAFKTLADDPALIGDALNALTKNDLGKLIGFSRPDWGKEALVNQAYQSLLDGFALGKQYGPEFWSPFTESQAQFHARKLQALKELVASQTQADLDAYAQQIKKRRDEAERKTAAEREALSNPQSLEDFNRFMEFHVRQGKTKRQARLLLTPEQRARFDALLVDQSSGARERLSKLASGAAQKEPETGAAATPSQAVGAKIVETKHTQKGHDLFVVQLEQRVSREDFQKLTASAKQLGGYYSAFRGKGAVPGFQFRDRSQAEAFLKMASGFAPGAAEKAQETAAQGGDVLDRDSAQPTAERLEQMADTLEARAIEQLSAERKTNTARRAAIASRIEARARDDQAMARTMRNIAKAIRDGNATFLSGVRTKSQVQFLENAVRAAKQDELLDKYGDYPKAQAHADEPPDADTVEYAEFPTFTAYRSDLVKLARGMQQVAGLKLLGTRLAKVVDVVPEEYKRFVEEHLNELTLARSKDGMPAVLRTENDAQLAIDRAGLSDKAIVLSLGRGKHVVVLSPYEAQRSGLWSGGDQKVTLKRQFVTEVMNRLKGLDSEQKTVRIPWQFEVAEERLKTLERMGIKTPAQYRSALREYIALRKAPQEEDRVKKLEREMVGRRNDGLDFFPTPEKTADEMVTAADIRPGMTVLEPSAGMGHIAERIREAGVEPDVVELSSERRQLLEAKGFNVVGHDFMEMQPSDTPGGEGYDRIVMNPPFSDGRDIQHVRHAYELLKPGGRLVAILSEGTFFRNTQQAKDFRSWLESVGATDEKLAEGTFEDRSLPVNTSANARMVVIEKPERVDFQMGDAGTDEFSRTERAYGGREAYERARAEGRTKLNYRQWVQVRTPAFKRWFGDWETLRAQKRTVAVEDAQKQAPAEAGAATAGHVRESSASAEVDPLLTAVTEFVRQPLRRVNPDTVSKVVDPQTGEPLVVYHGTTSNFDVFDSSWTDASPRGNTSGTGFFFSERPLEAEGYTWSASRVSGSIMPVYLSIKNPYVIGDRYSDAIWGRMLQSKAEAKKVRQELVHKGYDGVRTPLGEWVAFHPNQIKSAIGNRGTFSPENPDIRFSRAADEGQPAVRSTGFDKASGTVVADFKNDIPLKANPDYKAAKAGDTDAAVRLVKALVKPESIEAARAFGKDVTYVPVHAEEAAGLNKIPSALAAYYAKQTGADVGGTIVQTNRAYHTGANAMERLLARAEFSGKVEPGRRYVLVDDVTTMGSTLADLAHYIRSQGGEVAGSVVLVNAMRGGKMTADAKTVRELEARHGDEIRKLFGIEPRALTGPEAQYLIGFRTTDELRNRVAKARLERIARLHAKGVFPESQDSRGEISRLLGANAQGQQSARTAPERPYGGLSVSEVQRIADRIAEKWQQPPPITVLVRNPHDPDTPLWVSMHDS